MEIETLDQLQEIVNGTPLFVIPKISFTVTPDNYWASISATFKRYHPVQRIVKIEPEDIYDISYINDPDDIERAYYLDPEALAEYFIETPYGDDHAIGDPILVFTEEQEAFKRFYMDFKQSIESEKRLHSTLERMNDDLENSSFLKEDMNKYPERWV